MAYLVVELRRVEEEGLEVPVLRSSAPEVIQAVQRALLRIVWNVQEISLDSGHAHDP